jgi:hypothetical protein
MPSHAIDLKDVINRRRRQILVHSFLYYQMNTNIISDHAFDQWSKELADLQQQYPETARECIFAKEFESFDGSSGYNLPYHYPEIQSTARKLLKIHAKRKKDGLS